MDGSADPSPRVAQLKAKGAYDRWIFKLLRVGVVIVVLAVLLDFGARLLVENLVADRVADNLKLEETPAVHLDGFPFVAQVLSRRFSTASMEMEQVRRSRTKLTSVVLKLRNVSFSERGHRGVSGMRWIQIGRGDGRASLGEDALRDILESQDIDLDVALSDGFVVVRAPTCPGASETPCQARFGSGAVTVDNDGVAGVLVIPAPPPLDPIRITLPEIVDGFRAESAQIRRDRVVMAITLRDVDMFLRTGI